MAEQDPRTDEASGDDPGDEVTGFGLVGGLLGDGSVLPNPAQLPTGSVADIHITKKHDASSPLLMLNCADGKH